MALVPELMAISIENSLEQAGYKPTTDKAAGHDFYVAFSKGIIDHLNSNAEVVIEGGSSSGTYKVT
ncbi:hypothetical protein GV054_09155 [Marinomonas mediterranea]|jgi:hypothetical protein|uniref:Uncharacterized protein n=1 Tax=Marinomonas mediterranea (strain ATCC 700492 / JCM 21426 / NBRC 103028 / MMB-1) TaxID=717774 RepID=F2K223_MARM1|nr:hypothetical protein [Marinomonas mediterranea]ADZ91101.1 hypothetical protein Marme_1845 [Marinomonas mediterranea MMB-1]WCN13162.1 hypothetical protein GV054_09155 [Marinomonas mediterranea]WCN17233.1 hypothetical protein GV053_09315 [Marinomonas mediterranea MMB-1]